MHRLGSLVPVSPAREFRPGAGASLGGGVWEDTFTAAAPPAGSTKFMILHFAGFPCEMAPIVGLRSRRISA